MATFDMNEFLKTVSPEQEKYVKAIFNDATILATTIMNTNVTSAIKILQLLTGIAKLTEKISAQYSSDNVKGSTKRDLVLSLTRYLLSKLVTEPIQQATLLALYDTTSQPILDTLIDAANNINVTQLKACCIIS